MRGLDQLRESLADDLWDADEEEILDELGVPLADLLEDLAGVLRGAGNVAKVVGGELGARAPGILRGAATGMLAGGPAGAVLGAVGGGLAAPGATPTPAAATAPAGASGANAAALLLAMLRPEVAQALVALAAGAAGARTVPVAGVSVPVGAFANLFQSLAEGAASEHAGSRHHGVPEYLAEAAEHGLDIGSASNRAAVLLALLADAAEDDAEDLADDDADLADWTDLMDCDRLKDNDS